MPIKTYQVQPYVDDFAVQDQNFNNKTAEEKNFLRILFKPGVSVQVRELNQLQSILQNQIEKVGRGVFKEGPVPELAEEATIDSSISYVDIDIDATGFVDGLPYLNEIKAIRLDYDPTADPKVDFINAEVLHYQALSETNRYRFFIKYLSSVQDANVADDNVQEFSATRDVSGTPTPDTIEITNELLNPDIAGTTIYGAGTNMGTVHAVGKAMHAHTNEGVYFTKGQFVYSETQDIYVKLPVFDYLVNAKLVFRVVETIVNYQSDKSLLDNAAGYPNETAPGADRYTIDLQLALVSKDTTDNDLEFVNSSTNIFGYSTSIGDTLQLLEIDNGSVVQVARPEFSAMKDILAERTREESGDYALDPFLIDINGFYNDPEDDSICGRGVYTLAQMGDSDIVIPANDISGVAAGNLSEATVDANTGIDDKITFGKSRFIVGVEPSIAYVDGYRVAEPEKINVIGRKARDISDYQQTFTTAKLGSYFISESSGTPISGGAPSFDVDTLYNIKNAGSGGGSTLATCRVRSMEYDGTRYRLYVYDIQFANSNTSLSGAESIEIDGGGFTFEINHTDANGDPIAVGLNEPEFNKSIYKLPADFIESVKNAKGEIEFTARHVFTGASVTTTAGTNTVTINVPDSANKGDRFEIENLNSYIVIDGDGTIRSVSAIDLTTGTNNDTAVLTLSSAINTATGTTVIASYRSSLSRKSKTLTTVTDAEFGGVNTAIATGAEFTLDHYDIVKITSAVDHAGNDITDNLVFDDGQRDGCYKKGKLKYTGAEIAAESNKEGIKISYTYFLHGGGDYFSVDSYSVDYSEMPYYKDLFLADHIDFRAKLGTTDHGTHLDPNSAIDSQIRYYFSRIDKLVVTRDSQFKLVEGIPAVNPVEPEISPTEMHLYTLQIPAYTFCHTRIIAKYIDNRRYTMRDIGSIHSRVNNLEYYTTLSLLEKEATGTQIFETSSGNPYDRFKNGIIVDSFQSHVVGDVLDPNYQCSMDSADPVLRPYFLTRSVPFGQTGLVADNTNVEINDGIATLTHSQGPAWIDQQKAAVSISVNPYDVATWLGSVKLSPSSDEWMETRRAPNIVNEVGGSLEDLQANVNRINAMGTQWNSWQTGWVGTSRTTRIERSNEFGGRRRWPIRRATTTTTQTRQNRSGTRTTASIRSVTRQADDRVIDVSFVPFIRARKVYFSGKLFKPHTKLKVFFDGVDITKYSTGVTEANHVTWSSPANVNRAQVFHTRRHTQISGAGGDIITDNKGQVYGWFVVPNNSEHRFAAGERKVILSDGKDATDPAATTSADATYTAQGKMQTKQRTLITTRTVVRQSQRVSESRLLTSARTTRTQWYDPLAQSFIIGENPTGIFVHSVDLYFSHVPREEIPIKLYLVEMENGMPTQRRVPLSDVIKQPGDVATSDDATASTTFTFDSPIYLQYGTEYAMVTESNSSHYRQWLSEVGKEDVTTGEYISKNPFLGVSFKSQNASTWTPDQMKDFKMVVRRADYQTSGNIILHASGITVPQGGSIDETAGIDGPLEYSQVLLNTDFVEHPGTKVTFQISVKGQAFETIIPNENHYISTAVDSPIEYDDDLRIKVIMESDNSKVTPVVDLDRISLVAVKNIIGPEGNATTTTEDSVFQSGTDSEEAAAHGKATAVYMTKEVVLNNPSDRLDSYLNINLPYSDSNVLVYARFKRSEDNIEDITFDRIAPSSLIPVNEFDDYSEIKYTKDFSAGSEPLFTAFQIKIVMTSNDHALVPTVKDFRAIATV